MDKFSDEKKKTTALIALSANFGKELSAALFDLWLDLLDGYSAEQVQQAVKVVIETYEFKTMPPFAVLKKALDGAQGEDRKTLEDQAEAEWGLLLEEISNVGSYGTPQLHETTAYAVKQMGGWAAVCSWPSDSLGYRRKDFLEIWARSHGKVETMQLGANAVKRAAIYSNEPRHIGEALETLKARRTLQ